MPYLLEIRLTFEKSVLNKGKIFLANAKKELFSGFVVSCSELLRPSSLFCQLQTWEPDSVLQQ